MKPLNNLKLRYSHMKLEASIPSIIPSNAETNL